ncbi:hypothetical protein K523DRAFT_144810 [Schizophyllum commune Tattone D]|nr:hypothetical protein K523DRAFT_144810 [Schizophyllum commune Tattone D]
MLKITSSAQRIALRTPEMTPGRAQHRGHTHRIPQKANRALWSARATYIAVHLPFIRAFGHRSSAIRPPLVMDARRVMAQRPRISRRRLVRSKKSRGALAIMDRLRDPRGGTQRLCATGRIRRAQLPGGTAGKLISVRS